jgi:predicted outer membrane repeat protein
MFEAKRLLSGIQWYVNSLTDTGSGSSNQGDLRYCITEANLHTGDIIITASGTDTLGSSLPALTGDTTITNSSAGAFILNGGGTGSSYNALTINNGVTATITGVDFTNFVNSGNGGILDVEGTLTLDNCDLAFSSCNNGGAVFVGSQGELTSDNSTFHDNSSSDGGAILNDNSVVLNGGSLLNNSASTDGGAIFDDGYLDASAVEFAGNVAQVDGGAIYADYGMGEAAPNLLLSNCTIDSNTAQDDGGGIITYYVVTMTNDTIANNTSASGASGAGLYNANGSFTPGIYNTIIAQNLAGGSESDVDGSGSLFSFSSYNLIGNTSLSGITDGSQGNQIGTSGSPLDANLAPRANYGGTSDTLALNPGSPAIGAGLVSNAFDPATDLALPYDQRGTGFPRVVNGLVDIGAFQTQVSATNLAVSPSSGTYGGTTNVMATLSSGGTPISGELVDIQIGSTDLGTATTDSNGIAEIDNVSLAGLDAATYTGDITASFAGDSNFAFSSGSADLTVTPAPLTITANSQTKVYGAALPTLTVSYAGFVNGDTSANLTTLPTVTTTATPASHVDGSPYAITASGAVDEDYMISYVAGNLTVTPAPLTITANNQTKVYGTALPTLTASYTGFVNGDTSANLTTLPTVTTTATPASHVDGSPYAITASGAVDDDYAISYVAGNLTVTPAPLTITSNNQTTVYGAALPTLTASYTGFVNGDTPASLTTPVSLTTPATSSSPIGTYPIKVSGGNSADYTIVDVAGTLVIQASSNQVLFVNKCYTSYLGRTPEPDGLRYWTGKLKRGVSRSTVSRQIYQSPEARSHRAHLQGHAIARVRVLTGEHLAPANKQGRR